MSTIELTTKDEKKVVVEIEILKSAKLISKVWDEGKRELKLSATTSLALERVIQWATYHKNDEDVPEDISAWDAAFLNVNVNILLQLILAANELQLMGLLNICCQNTANRIKGKTPEQIRATFNIENDFTPEEEERLKREGGWAFMN